MAKITIGFEDYEEPTWEEYTGPDPKPGSWHTAVLKKAIHKPDDEAVLFILEVTEGDFKGWGRGFYGQYTGERKWKSQQAIRALQGGQTKAVTLDWDNEKVVETWVGKQKPVRIKIGAYNDRVNIDKVAPLMTAVGAPGLPAKEAEKPGDGDGPVEDYTEEELAALEVADLVEILTDEFEVTEDDLPAEPVKPRRDPDGSKMKALEEQYKDALIDMILEEQDGEPGATAEAADEDGDFEDGFEADPEPEPEPAPAPARRSRAAKAAPAKAAAAPAATTRRRRS